MAFTFVCRWASRLSVGFDANVSLAAFPRTQWIGSDAPVPEPMEDASRAKETTLRHHRCFKKEGQIYCHDTRAENDNGVMISKAAARLESCASEKGIKYPAKRPKMENETQRQRISNTMRSFITKGRLFAAAVIIILLVAGFLVGVHHGYNLGYREGENRTNGWWIDKKTQYYESAEIRKKRINLKHNHI
jgi:hypothetical protein